MRTLPTSRTTTGIITGICHYAYGAVIVCFLSCILLVWRYYLAPEYDVLSSRIDSIPSFGSVNGYAISSRSASNTRSYFFGASASNTPVTVIASTIPGSSSFTSDSGVFAVQPNTYADAAAATVTGDTALLAHTHNQISFSNSKVSSNTCTTTVAPISEIPSVTVSSPAQSALPSKNTAFVQPPEDSEAAPDVTASDQHIS